MASKLDQQCIDTLRFLSVDMVEKAKSGHPGLPLGAAPAAYALWSRMLKHNPKNPTWFDRDRFVLSAGHGSALLYSLLHLTGYDLPLDEIKRFRQWGSKTPGHPERGHTAGVEVSTGPLGQGMANAIGMALGEAHLAARYNRDGHTVIDHHTWALVSDGDLMEGVTSEASSLAGHWQLGKLICLYDDNEVTLAGHNAIAFTEDRAKRFEGYGWHTVTVADGNDLDALIEALAQAKAETQRPSLVLVRSHIGFGSPKQDSFKSHGSPLGPDDTRKTKEHLGWPTEPAFLIPDAALAEFRTALDRGTEAESQWQARFDAYAAAFPELGEELAVRMRNELPPEWDIDLPEFPVDEKGIATRVAGGKVMNAIAPKLPALVGGSADLDPSTFTALKDLGDFNPPPHDKVDEEGSAGGGWSPSGRNIHYGVREHAMGSISNGLAAHGGFIPFGATFLIFSDYMRPTLRLAALSHLHVIHVYTHDSVALGEDGPTHQPIEQLASLRAIPNLTLIRPADANETAVAWRVAIETRDRPVLLSLTRQEVPTIPRTPKNAAEGLRRGAYVVDDGEASPQLLLLASGSEVGLILDAAKLLRAEGIAVRCISMPSWDLFEAQDKAYRDAILPPSITARMAVELGASQGWDRYVGPHGAMLCMERFGASAPTKDLLEHFGFTVENVVRLARRVVEGATGL